MTKLEMHKKLQPLYKKVMGEFKSGDRVYRHSTIFGEELDSQIWTEDKRNEIVIIREKSDVKGYWHCTNEKGEERLLTDQDMLDTTCYRLPLPIDPVNPKRGLWGMVDWSKLRYEQWGPDGEIAIFKLPYIQYNEEMGIPVKDHPFIVGDPEEALLKALMEQEGL